MTREKIQFRKLLSREGLQRFKPRRKYLFRFGIGFVAFFIVVIGSIEFTSRPKFCTSCHYMEPFYESWQMSSHKDINCTTCHFPPGVEGTVRGKLAGLEQVISYVGRSYTRRKPWAEIEDASCLQSGCHETRKMDGKVDFKGVVFDHTDHLGELRRGKQLRCTSCHSQVVQGDHLVVTESTCFLCHMKKGGEADFALSENAAKCQNCHDWSAVSPEKMASFRYDHTDVVKQQLECTRCHSQTVVGDGFVPKENCTSCHFETERLEKYDDDELMHRIHITEHKVECAQCHLEIQHKIQRVSASAPLNCTTCHSETHSEQLQLLTGRDLDGFEGPPNPMLEAGLGCASCHVFHRQLIGDADVRTAKSQSCESCHGKGYGRLLGLWEASATTKLERLSRDVARTRQLVRDRNSGNRTTIEDKLVSAEEDMRIVKVGKAVHNIKFSDQLISHAYENLNAALEAAGSTVRLGGTQPENVVPSECANCHTGGEVISVEYKGRTFKHEVHVVDNSIECKECHSNARTHGELIVSDFACNSCHHSTEDLLEPGTCESCHETVATIYSGTYADHDIPDYMFDEEVTCDDCHWNESRIVLPEPSVCVDCHDDDYADQAEEWLQDLQDATDDIRALLERSTADKRTNDVHKFAKKVLRDLGPNAVRGIHNYELTIEILQEVKSKLENPGTLP